MKGWDNELYVTMLIISNAIAILQLIAAIKWPRIARFSFFILFAWASWINWITSQKTPQFYLEYADLAWSGWYRNFITGWFSDHIPLTVGLIASCQALIAASMLLKKKFFLAGSVAAIIFLLAILPLGIGAGFPCTAIMAAALFILARRHNGEFIWEKKQLTTG
jgi:hypothetical protein